MNKMGGLYVHQDNFTYSVHQAFQQLPYTPKAKFYHSDNKLFKTIFMLNPEQVI